MAAVQTMMRTTTVTATTAPTKAAVLSLVELLESLPVLESVVESVVGCSHSFSSREEMATGQPESTLSVAPLTVTLGSPLTHSSIREISELLLACEVPSSLARYVT